MAEPTTVALLHCPFCNSAARLFSIERYHKGSGIADSVFVECTRCKAAGPFVESGADRQLTDVEKQAAALWNRRGRSQSADWKLERIARILNSNFIAPLTGVGSDE